MLSSFVKPKDHISTIAPLLPERNSPIQKNGNGNQSCYLAEISIDLGSRLLAIISNRETAITGVLYDLEKDANENEIEHDIKQLQIAETEKEQIIKSRRGQGTFRINVEKIESGCRITGITDRRFLVASHIKPWRDSDNTERLDGSNGLLLSPHIDKLFDNGWISFSDDGLMLIASNEISDILQAWKIDSNKCVGSFHERQKNYLGYHRKNIYRGT
nr:HNH endonuclease [Mariprofundus sp. KV]